MSKHKVLLDLLPAMDGFAGIPQESRLLFRLLANDSQSMAVGGLIYSHSEQALKYQFKSMADEGQDIITASNYLDNLIGQQALLQKEGAKRSTLRKIKNRFDKIKIIFLLFIRRSFLIKEINANHFFGFLWRVFFQKTLKKDDFDLLKKQRYFISNLNARSMKFWSWLKGSVSLKTNGWDFVIFQFQRSVKVSPGTKKIVRYHDSIAFQDMDVTVFGSNLVHATDLKNCQNDSFYVCNSEPTRKELCKLVPSLITKSITIPPILAAYQKMLDSNKLLSVIRRSFSSALLSDAEQKLVSDQLMQHSNFRYLLILATLEPRKNHVGLIRAWEKLREEQKSDIKLMIVGSLGWKYEDILLHMKPHVQDGNIIHLEKIAPIDMGLIYSHADAFVFPSFNEGFGSPPLEAMQCDCPVIASDIETHRWAYGDAAFYCDPFDNDSIVKALNLLLFSVNSSSIRQDLIEKGREQVKRYSEDRIREQWLQLFDRLSS